MHTKTTPTTNNTDNAGFPPAPSEAHQRSGNERREVIMNGSRILMLRIEGKWVNVNLTPN